MGGLRAVCIRWTGLGTGLWDWTHRKLRSSFLKARKQEIAERHYTAATVDNSLPSTQDVPTQLSPCRPSYHAKQVRFCFGANSSMICHDDFEEHMAVIASKLSYTKCYNHFAAS